MKEKREFRLHNGTSGSAVTIRVVPKSSRNELSEILNDGTIKIRLTASAAEEATNRALIGFLAEILEVETARVEIVAGVTGKDKLVTVTNMDAESVQQKILQKLA